MRPIMRAAYLVYRLYLWLTRPLSVGCAGVVVDRHSRVLLVRHTYQKGWHLPGGGVKRGESALQALTRELREEVGIEFDHTETRLVGLYYQRVGYKHDHQAVFLVPCLNPPNSFLANMEIEEASFFDVCALPAETGGACRDKIAAALKLLAGMS